MLKEGLTAAIVDGGDAISRFSVVYWRKGTRIPRLLEASWRDSSCTVGSSSTAVSMVVTARPGKVPTDGDGRRQGC
jgi:hypothetical protein